MGKKRLPEETKRRIDEATEQFRRQLEELCDWSYGEDENAPTAVEIEKWIQEWTRRIGKDAQLLSMEHLDHYRRKGKRSCPCCGEEVYWKRYEPRRYLTTQGVLWLERAYYHHGPCHCGWAPLDERLQLGASEMSPLVEEMVSFLGASMPFEQARKYLAKYHHIEIGVDALNNCTVRIGQELEQIQAEKIKMAWEKGQLPEVETREAVEDLYVSADGINHLQPDGQGRELKVAAIYETEEQTTAKGEGESHAVHVEYVVGRQAETLAQAAYVRGVARGVQQSEKRIVLGDGAHWIWNRVAPAFRVPDCIEIVDFYHTTKYLWSAGEEAYGEGNVQAKIWAQEACHHLKHKGPQAVMQELAALPVPRTKSPKAIQSAIRYLKSHGQRMNYPDYRQQGLQIGSGTAESGVQRVVGSRMNQPGMRWNTHRAEYVAHVRAAILSDHWDDFWAHYTPPPRQYRSRAA
jgi:hypothetical protein